MYQRKQASYKGYVLYNFIYMALWTHEIHKQRGQSRGSSEQGAGKSSWQQRGMRNLWRQWNCVDNDGYIWFWDHASSESYNIELMLYHKLHQKKKDIRLLSWIWLIRLKTNSYYFLFCVFWENFCLHLFSSHCL